MRRCTVLFAWLFVVTGVALAAASPPGLIHYQGVLRGSDDTPKDGDFDMIFRFFDAAALGNEILVDAHTDGGLGAVTVNGGLFGVPLGSGLITDGTGPGAYGSLQAVFLDFSGVWLELQVEGETLSPRVQVLSAAYALNAGSLGGSSPGDFLLSSASDTYANGTLTLAASSVLDVNGEIRLDGTLFMNPDGPDGTQSIFFHAFGEPAARSLSWDQTGSRFLFDDTVRSTGNLSAGGALQTDATTVSINVDGPDADQTIGFYSGAADGETLGWDTANSRFELSDDLVVGGSLRVGSILLAPISYNAIGAGAPDSGDMTATSDLYVTSDLEVDSQLYLNGEIRMDDDGPEGDQEIFFYEDGLPTGESIAWRDAADEFSLSDDLDVAGILGAGTVLAGAVLSNTLEGGGFLELRSGGNVRFVNGGVSNLFEWYQGVFSLASKRAEMDSSGDLRIEGTLSQNVNFDVAETFLMSEPVEPGDLVAVDPARPVAVRRTKGETDPLVLGVVSASPGVLLGDAPFSRESLERVWGAEIAARYAAEADGIRRTLLQTIPGLAQEQSAIEEARAEVTGGNDSGDDATSQARRELALREEALAGRLETEGIDQFFARHFAAVALAGRVPVKVDGRFGDIAPGDGLTPSPVPGVAMKATGPGPIVGTALEAFSGEGGKVLMFVHRDGRGVSEEAVEKATAAVERRIDERTPDPATGTQALDGNLQIVLDRGDDDRARFSLHRDGEATIGAEVFRVDEEGNVWIRGSLRPSSMDLAEYYPVSEAVEPGDVLILDREAPGSLRRAFQPGDTAVVGVVSKEPGVLLGSGLSRIREADPELARRMDDARAAGDRREEARLWSLLEGRFRERHAPLALSGNVPCKVDAGYGTIRAGDLLTTSPTPGHAMRTDEPGPGTIVGKALESLETGTGTIRVLVTLR